MCIHRDLKRDVANKLEKLERRTQRAIVELISRICIAKFLYCCNIVEDV